ncbi:MAG: DNA repair protein RadA [Verrucomicrobia bacterium]|nr:DNA repair protein RadA [Verrucomicrobiota bacterium]
MAKAKTVWFCNECGHKELKWVGQCASCREWNTLKEEVEIISPPKFAAQTGTGARPMRLSEVNLAQTPRMQTGMQELDRLLGGGLVPGSLVLIGGEPGIGKSTLLQQLAGGISQKVLYVCGEESVEQTAERAKRLGISAEHLYFLCETDYTLIKGHIDALEPTIVVVDSIQIVYKAELSSAPGSVTQVRETASEFMHLAKGRNITIFLVGHVTKSGEIAGPKVLEHLVDTVLYFEGDRQQNYRLLRVVKNRFGPTDEIAVFQMSPYGLCEVPNPSQIFLEERRASVPGSVIIPTLEGTRPFLVEVQALVTETPFPNPSRKVTGIDPNRLALLLAVLEKKLKYRLFNCDVFVSVAGGLRIKEPSADLGILLAIASSFCNVFLHPETVVLGEVGLGGEIRAVSRVELRIKEAQRMGFSRCILPKRNLKGLATTGLKLVGVDLVEEAIDAFIQG